MADRITVAGVVARLGFETDSSGARRFEEEVKRARRMAEHPIEAELGAHVEDGAFSIYAKKLREAEERAQRKALYQAHLGADFDAKSFNAAERERAAAIKRSNEKLEADRKAQAVAIDKANAEGTKSFQRAEDEKLSVARRGSAARVALVDDLVATIRGREEDLAKATREIDAHETAERVRRSTERITQEVAEGEKRLANARKEQQVLAAEGEKRVADAHKEEERIAKERARGAEKRLSLVEDLLGTLREDEKRTAAVTRAIDEAEMADRVRHVHERTVLEEQGHAERKRIADQEFAEGGRRRQLESIDTARGAIPLRKRIRGEQVTTTLGFDVDEKGFLLYEKKLREAENKASRREKYKAHLGVDFDEASFAAAEHELDNLGRAADRASGKSNRQGGILGLGTSFLGLRGNLLQMTRIASVAIGPLVALGTELVALAASAAAAVAGIGALGVGLVAALGPVGLVIGAVVKRASLLTEAWKATQNATAKSGVDATAAARAHEAAADGIKNADRGLRDAHDAVTKAQDDLTDANFRARREMQDLRIEVERTAQSEKRANLSLEEALVNLDHLQADPAAKRADLRDAKLSVEEAKSAVSDAALAHKRAAEDRKRGTDTVANAQDNLKNAEDGVTQAADGVRKAHEAAADAAEKQSSAANTALQKLGKLSKGEKEFLEGFGDFVKNFGKAMRPATDAIFGSLGQAFKTIAPLLEDFSGSFIGIGKALGAVIERAAKALSGPEWRAALTLFSKTGTSIIEPLFGAFGKFFELFRNIAVAAQPLVKEFVGNLEKWFGGLAKGTGNLKNTRKFIEDLVEHTRSWVNFLGQALRLVFNVFAGGAKEGKGLLDVWTKILVKWNKFLESKEGRAETKRFFTDARSLLNDIYGFLKGVVEGFGFLFGKVKGVAGFFIDLAKAVLGLNGGGTKGLENIGKVLGAVALLRLVGVTKLFGLMLAVGKGAKGIAAAVAAFNGIRVAKAAAGGKGSILDLFKGRGDSPAKPMYVWQVNDLPGGGKGPGGVPPVVTGGGKGAGRLLPKLLKGAGKLGAAAAAVDLAVNLVDSKGNPIAAVVNSAHDLSFGIIPKLNVKSAGERQKEQLKKLGQELTDALDAGDPKKIAAVRKEISALADESQRFGDKKLAKQFKDIEDTVSKGRIKSEVDKAAASFADWRKTGSNNMKGIQSVVASNTASIRTHLGKDTADGKDAAVKNFRLARTAIRQAMEDGKISVKDGLAYIKRLFHAEMREYGFTAKQADRYKAGNDPLTGKPIKNTSSGQARGGYVKRAAGGWLGARGMVSDDVVAIGPGMLAAYGEYDAHDGEGGRAIINRHQAPVVEQALAWAGSPSLSGLPAGRQLPMIESAMAPLGGLDNLFDSITTPHYLASGGRFRTGGRPGERPAIGPVPGFPGEEAARSVIPKIIQIARKYHLILTDAFDRDRSSGHTSPGHNVTGTAADFDGSDRNMDRAVRDLVGQGYVVGYDGRFGSQRWAGHGPSTVTPNHHFHVELGGGGSGGTGSLSVKNIKPPNLKGEGLYGTIRQGILNRVAAAATRQVKRVANAPVGHGGSASADPAVVRAFRRAIGVTRPKPNSAERLALWEAGLVESELHNLNYGDRDSLGSLQEREGIYGRAHAMSPFKSATRFLKDAVSKRPWRSTPGLLAQAVQRSGRPSAYDMRSRDAHRYLGRGGRQRFMRGGRGSAYDIGKLQSRITHKNKAYQAIMGDRGTVAVLGNEYEFKDREYNVDTEEYVKPDGSLDDGAINRRAAELDALIAIRQKIIDELDKALVIARRVVKTYTTIMTRLRKSIKHASKKERGGIRARIAGFRTDRGEWQDTITDLKDTRRSAVIDKADTQAEKNEVLGTKSSTEAATPLDYIDAAVAAAASTNDGNVDDIIAGQSLVDYWKDQLRIALTTSDPRDDTLAYGGLSAAQATLEELRHPAATANQQAIIDQLTTANNTLQANLATSQANLSVFAGTGDIGTGLGVNAFSSVARDSAIGVGAGEGRFGHVVHVHQNNLVPGSAATLRATGDAVVNALEGRGHIPTRTERVG